MEQMIAQVAAMTEEIQLLKNEVVGVKASHATLHQQSVEKNVMDAGRHADAATRIAQLEEGIERVRMEAPTLPGGTSRKPLIEPKQVAVEVFSGSMTDSRSKFLEWGERVKDRAGLQDPATVEGMEAAEKESEPIDEERSKALGMTTVSSRELHGFLKDRTSGTAASIVRNNRSGIGLESWRLLNAQFNPKTLLGTMTAQDMETKPKGAAKMSDLPGCIQEWEKSLRRCVQEGRTPPDDSTKRLALLRMIPPKQRGEIWQTANKLYPTFGELLAKVQEMIQDEFDAKNSNARMDIDQVEDNDDSKWQSTGQVLTGKGPNGEETLFLLQRRGNATRIKPKGNGKGTRSGPPYQGSPPHD